MRFSKIIYVLIILVTLTYCRNHNDPVNFDTIDYSFFSDYYQSIKIYKNGDAYIHFDYHFEDHQEFYSLRLTKTQMDSLSRLCEILYSKKTDSIICLRIIISHLKSFSLIVDYKNHRYQTSYAGGFPPAPEYQYLYNLADYLDELIYNKRATTDPNFVFKSRTLLLLPPSPSQDLNDKK
jgi:hypothetical protein